MNKPTFGTYRGWSEEYNEWVYGALINGWPKGHHRAYLLTEDDVNEYDDGSPRYNSKLLDSIISVIPQSLAMFTGQYDKDDKPIYGSFPLPDGSMSNEGDILSGDGYPYINKGQQNYVAIPSWNGDATYYVVGDVKGISHGLPINEELNELKIIGNAYENPELLEGEA